MAQYLSDDTWQHDLSHNGACDVVLFREGLVVVAAIDRDGEREFREHQQILTTPSDTAQPMVGLRRGAGGKIADEPVIAVASATIDSDQGRRGPGQPWRG